MQANQWQARAMHSQCSDTTPYIRQISVRRAQATEQQQEQPKTFQAVSHLSTRSDEHTTHSACDHVWLAYDEKHFRRTRA